MKRLIITEILWILIAILFVILIILRVLIYERQQLHNRQTETRDTQTVSPSIVPTPVPTPDPCAYKDGFAFCTKKGGEIK